jgi:hypothetical protein
MVQELFRGPLLERLLARTPLVVVDPYEERQLHAEVGRQPDLKAVAMAIICRHATDSRATING